MDTVKNFAKALVSTGYGYTATSMLATGQGARFPSAPFNAVWWNVTDYPNPSDDPGVEIVRVTSKASDTFTVQRGQEGTTAVNHNESGKEYGILAGITAAMFNAVGTDLAAAAPLASPAFTGTPTAPTQGAGNNSTRLATTAFVQQEIASSLTSVMILKGAIDCSTNPNYPSASVVCRN